MRPENDTRPSALTSGKPFGESVVGLGIDIVSKKRIGLAIDRTGDAFIVKVFVAEEISYCKTAAEPLERYAAFFAAKEAVAKGLGCGIGSGLSFHDIVIHGSTGAAPAVSLHGRGAEIARERGIDRCLLALSHHASDAVAIAVMTGERGRPMEAAVATQQGKTIS
jgi:holo-[acyl-carrier protein] synthase